MTNSTIPRKTSTAPSRPSAPRKALNRAVALQAIVDARKDLERVDLALVKTVAKGRRLGVTWDEIGNSLGISRQAACQRFGGTK